MRCMRPMPRCRTVPRRYSEPGVWAATGSTSCSVRSTTWCSSIRAYRSFSISQIGIGDVAVGGYVPKYENAASVIASQIKEYYASGKIDGTHFRLTDGQYLFDSRKLKELKIAEYALPKGSVVEDTVAAKLSKYSHYIELLVAGIVLLVLLLVSLRRFSCARGVSSARSKSARDSWWSPARRPKSPTCSNRRSWPI